MATTRNHIYVDHCTNDTTVEVYEHNGAKLGDATDGTGQGANRVFYYDLSVSKKVDVYINGELKSYLTGVPMFGG